MLRIVLVYATGVINVKNKSGIYKTVGLLILTITATYLWLPMFSFRYEAVTAMADGKTPVTIIMYHSITRNRTGDYFIPPELFESDIKYLKDNGYNFVTITDIINYVNRLISWLPEKAVVITFDDGYYNNYLYAYPVMQEHDLPFVIAVLGHYTDMNKEGDKMHEDYSHLTWEQIREMDRSGIVEIQNHSYNLHTFEYGRVGSKRKHGESLEDYRKILTEDLMKLQELLKEHSDVWPNTFVYPFGSISPESVEILRDMGVKAALTASGGINYLKKGDEDLLFNLKRFNRPYGKSSEAFFKDKLAGY